MMNTFRVRANAELFRAVPRSKFIVSHNAESEIRIRPQSLNISFPLRRRRVEDALPRGADLLVVDGIREHHATVCHKGRKPSERYKARAD